MSSPAPYAGVVTGEAITTGGFPPLLSNNATGALPTSNTSEATESHLGKIRNAAASLLDKHTRSGQGVAVAAIVVCSIVFVFWVVVGYCEKRLPPGLARALARFDMFSHSHYSDVLPRVPICQKTVLGGMTTIVALISTTFLTAYVIVSRGDDGAWETVGQYGVIDQACELSRASLLPV